MNGRNSTPRHLLNSDVFEQIASAERLILFLDYDGTLVPFKKNPSEATPTEEVVEVLRGLAGLEDVFVCIITGRALDDILSLLGVEGLWFAALHGIETLSPGGERRIWKVSAWVEELIGEIKERVEELFGDVEGVFVEDKKYALAVHYRGNPGVGKQVVRVMRDVCRGHSGVELLCGNMVVEVRICGWDKGRAVDALLDSVFGDGLVVYLGDDRTDEDAFCFLKGQGITVRVLRDVRETCAEYYLLEDEVLPFLERVRVLRDAQSF